jgi:predicted DNA-binding transcriptional regulator YafY
MHRVTIRDRDDALVAAESLPNVVEPFSPGKVYELFNPSTGEKIPGQTFTAEQVYAIIYSMMFRALSDREAAAAAAAAALAAEEAARDAAAAEAALAAEEAAAANP